MLLSRASGKLDRLGKMVRQTTISLPTLVASDLQKLERALWLTPGVWLIHLNLAAATAYVEYKTDECTPQALTNIVARSVSAPAREFRSVESRPYRPRSASPCTAMASSADAPQTR
jgi:hypothetical protein